MPDIERLVAFFESMTPASIGAIDTYYADDACFKDPFNDVRGIGKIRRVYAHMFEQVAEPRFHVTERLVAGNGAFLTWDFMFRFRPGGAMQTVHGSSHLRFDTHGKIVYHCDYWDAAGELYAKVPVLGALMRLARRRLSAGA